MALGPADKPLFGTHVSVAGGFHEGLRRGSMLACDAIQVFTKSNRQWAAPAIGEDQIQQFREAWKESAITSVLVHAAYLINLASARESVRRKSLNALIDEVKRADSLGLHFVVFHPGSHGGDGDQVGLGRLVDGLRRVLDATASCQTALALETMAGQGTCLGATFDHLAHVLQTIDHPRLGVCLDSCHLHAAGYALASPAAATAVLDEFAATIGFEHLLGAHLNDSRYPAGSRRDRHAHIGEGHIPESAFAALIQDKRFHGIPMILETPKSNEDVPVEDRRNLATLRRLLETSL